MEKSSMFKCESKIQIKDLSGELSVFTASGNYRKYVSVCECVITCIRVQK